MRGSFSIFTHADYDDRTQIITTTYDPTMDISGNITMSSMTISEDSSTDISKIHLQVAAGVTVVVMVGLLATVVALLFLVCYKRKRSALVNLTKPNKGSEENSYVSSEHSHQQGSKYSESLEPGYDVAKSVYTKYLTDKIFSQNSSHLDMNPTHLSEYASIEDISSSHKTFGSYICSPEYSATSTKENPSRNCQKCGEMKQKVFIADSEIEDKDKQKQLTEDAAKCNNNSTKGEASPIPPQTIEMMYTTVQNKPKVNTGMDSDFEDSTPPPPPQTTEMMYTAVQKRPKDSILAEVEDDAPPVLPYMEKEDKETEATAKGSDEGSPPPLPTQTNEMLYTAV